MLTNNPVILLPAGKDGFYICCHKTIHMLRKLPLLAVTLLAGNMFLAAQETDYKTVSVDFQAPPSLTQYNAYQTFDVAVVTTQSPLEKKSTVFSTLPYQLKLGRLQQVDSTGDFHIVCLVQKFGVTITSNKTATVKIGLSTTVYDKYGKDIKSATLNNDQFAVDFGRELTKDELAARDVPRRIIMEKGMEACLKSFTDALFGATLRPEIKVASLDDVKKKPELQEFDVQQKALTTALQKEGFAGFKRTAEPFLPYWEKMSNYSGEGDANEVKRAAYHNLTVYHIASGDYDKAKEYIELYKPIDKTIKEMFGLIKYKNSEECEKLVAVLSPAPAAEPVAAGGTVMSKAAIVDNYQFLIIDGTARISGKKEAGTYTGLIKVYKIPAGSFGNIVSLDPENIVVNIDAKDASGQQKNFETAISKIEELKDKNGTSYVTQKFGNAMLGDGSYYAFMQSTYSSPKITVYRTILPAGNGEYVVKKPGDDKGVKSSLFGARKNLNEYLSDCAPLAEKLKNGSLDKTVSPEKLAEMYTNCQ